MESNNLAAEEVVARGDGRRNASGVNTTIGNELVNSPSITAQAIVIDLEPLEAVGAGGGSVSNLGEVGKDRALVGRVDLE